MLSGVGTFHGKARESSQPKHRLQGHCRNIRPGETHFHELLLGQSKGGHVLNETSIGWHLQMTDGALDQ